MTHSTSLPAGATLPQTRASSPPGAALGGVGTILRLEGLAVFAAALAAYAHLDGSWIVFAALFLAPDLAMAFYLAGPRLGAAAYNVAHAYVGPLALAAAGLALAAPAATALALVWLAHIAFDRALGFGLKYATGFGDTHLGRVGAAAA
jgi:hypothetical protein